MATIWVEKKKAIELLHRVGIRDHQDIMKSYPSDITEGEAQKVMIAMAVANQPDYWWQMSRLILWNQPRSCRFIACFPV